MGRGCTSHVRRKAAMNTKYTGSQLPEHPNGLAFSVYDKNGDLLAINEYFSVSQCMQTRSWDCLICVHQCWYRSEAGLS